MVDTTKAMESDYLNVETVKNSQTKKIIIIDGGKYENTDYGSNKLTMRVSIDGMDKIWRPNRDSVKNLSTAWGRESNIWVQKIATLTIVSMNGKESIVAIVSIDEPVIGEEVVSNE